MDNLVCIGEQTDTGYIPVLDSNSIYFFFFNKFNENVRCLRHRAEVTDPAGSGYEEEAELVRELTTADERKSKRIMDWTQLGRRGRDRIRVR